MLDGDNSYVPKEAQVRQPEQTQEEKFVADISKLSQDTSEIWQGKDKQKVESVLKDFSSLSWMLLTRIRDGKSLHSTIHHNFAHMVLAGKLRNNAIARLGDQPKPELLNYFGTTIADRRTLAINLNSPLTVFSERLAPSQNEEDVLAQLNVDDSKKDETRQAIENLVLGINNSALQYGVGDEEENADVVNYVLGNADSLAKMGLPMNETYVRALEALAYGSTVALASGDQPTVLLERTYQAIDNTIQSEISQARGTDNHIVVERYSEYAQNISVAKEMSETSMKAIEIADRSLELMHNE